MKIGEKEISTKDLEDTVKCNKKVIEHIRKKLVDENSYRDKLKQEPTRLSDYEKCFRTTLVRTELFMLCAMGLGKFVCESFDMIKDEEKMFVRRLTDKEVYQIITDIASRHMLLDER